jgi:hypothetical protein
MLRLSERGGGRVMNEYDIRFELVYFTKWEGVDADHAKEGAIEYFLDELATTRNREEWRELLEVEVRKI